MKDIEASVYGKVKTALATEYPTMPINTVEDYSPAKFPCVQIFEADNSTDADSVDSGSFERYCNVMYEAWVWAEGPGRKTSAKAICNKIDSVMIGLGFRRTGYAPLVMDKNIFRIVSRYEAKVGTKGNDSVIYRR